MQEAQDRGESIVGKNDSDGKGQTKSRMIHIGYYPVDGGRLRLLETCGYVTVGWILSFLEEKYGIPLLMESKRGASTPAVIGMDSYQQLGKRAKTMRRCVWLLKRNSSRPRLKIALFCFQFNRRSPFRPYDIASHEEPNLVLFMLLLLLRLSIGTKTMTVAEVRQKVDVLTVSWGKSPYFLAPGGLRVKWSSRSMQSMVGWRRRLGALTGVDGEAIKAVDVKARIDKSIIALGNQSRSKSSVSRCALL